MKPLTSPITPEEMTGILARKKHQLKLIRGFDLVSSSIGLLLLSPVLLLVAGLIKLDSHGPVVYRQTRIGKDEKPFSIIKFRSMDRSEDGPLITTRDDKRITRIGRLIRKGKLDELPQLLNVIKGDMSLVGPRPEVPKYVALYDENARQILRVRPGITDLASIAFFDESSILSQSDDIDKVYIHEIMPVKHGLNYEYIRQMSLPFNLKVIFKTIWVVLTRKG